MKATEALVYLKQISYKRWQEIYKELSTYTDKIIKYKKIPGKLTSDDIIQDSILKLLNGDRKWDSASKPDLIIHMKGVIKSLLWSYHISNDNKLSIELSDEYLDTNYELNCSRPEDTFDAEILLNCVFNLVRNDADLYRLVIYLVETDGNDPRQKIAKELGFSLMKLNNLIKKLRSKRKYLILS